MYSFMYVFFCIKNIAPHVRLVTALMLYYASLTKLYGVERNRQNTTSILLKEVHPFVHFISWFSVVGYQSMIRRSWVGALACADIYVPAILRSRTSWQLKAILGIVKMLCKVSYSLLQRNAL